MRKGIISDFIQLAADEGELTATRQLQDIQQTLETILESANELEFKYASELLKRVNKAIVWINESSLVTLARSSDEGVQSESFRKAFVDLWAKGNI